MRQLVGGRGGEEAGRHAQVISGVAAAVERDACLPNILACQILKVLEQPELFAGQVDARGGTGVFAGPHLLHGELQVVGPEQQRDSVADNAVVGLHADCRRGQRQKVEHGIAAVGQGKTLGLAFFYVRSLLAAVARKGFDGLALLAGKGIPVQRERDLLGRGKHEYMLLERLLSKLTHGFFKLFHGKNLRLQVI